MPELCAAMPVARRAHGGEKMNDVSLYLLAADAVLLVHLAFVLFVVLGLLSILAGRALSWSWVRNPWFRLYHLFCIGIVVFQSWGGVICPLTNWEMALRREAGDTAYAGTFVAHWLGSLLYIQAPEWVFVLAYTVFGLLVAASWFWVRPYSFSRGR